MEFTFLGGASEVGASCTILQLAGHRLLVDGGMRPAVREGQSRLPDLSLLEQHPPEALLITHAHIDHTGALPLIAALFPHIPIYATESTRVLTEILLRDSVHVMEQEGLKPDGETPLYNSEQVDVFLARIQLASWQQPITPLPETSDISVRFLPAGHILGAAMLFFSTPEGTLLHTGDISITDQRTIKGIDINSLPQADVMICEGTYGNRAHSNRKEEERKLVETVQHTIARGGRILCPAFAVGRAQEVILILKFYRASGQVSPAPIYLDGMVRSVCTAYQLQSHDLRNSLQRYQQNSRRPLFTDPGLHIFAVHNQERTKLIHTHTPMMIISSSGMLAGGASPLYAADIAEREQDCILFTGYQDEESPGATLLEARQGDTLHLGEQHYTLACQVERYNLSGHADAEQLVHAVQKVNPRHLLLVHGTRAALETLAQRLSRIKIDIPVVGSTIQASGHTSLASPNSASQTAPPFSAALTEQRPSTPNKLPPPTIQDLWKLAARLGPLRPWTSVELGQHYYEAAYHPSLRSQIELTLKEVAPYFKQGRLGTQPTYQPRSQSETDHLQPLSLLTPDEIVLVQGHRGTPQLALLLSQAQNGSVSLIGDQWKQSLRPINVIQLVPDIQRNGWSQQPEQVIKQQLQVWKAQVERAWIDLLARWDQQQVFTFASVCAEQPSEDLRLAWGLELLLHGHELFQRNGSTFLPFEPEKVLNKTGFAHHIELLHAGAGAQVCCDERKGILTGRSNWRTFEVQWQDGEQAGTETRVRATNIQLGNTPKERK